jgi:CRP-like cAMP-binding protein
MHSVVDELLKHPEFLKDTHWREKYYPAGSTIFEDGSTSKNLFIVSNGLARVNGQVNVDDARNMKMGIGDLHAGELFGEMTFFDGQPRSASVVAIEDSELIELDGKQLMAFLDQHPELGYRFMKLLLETMVGRLRTTTSRMFSFFGWGLRGHGIDSHM